MPRVAVMISGTGTLLQSLIDDPRRTYDIVAVAADRPAQGLARAEAAGIPTVVCGPGSMEQGHKADEFISLQQLDACDRMLERVVEFVRQ